MPPESHVSRVCTGCGGHLQPDVDICPWCRAPVSAQRLRVRKRRSPMSKYAEHVRRHWIYFVLAILAAIVAAWFLLEFAQRPSRRPPAPTYITATNSSDGMHLDLS